MVLNRKKLLIQKNVCEQQKFINSTITFFQAHVTNILLMKCDITVQKCNWEKLVTVFGEWNIMQKTL